MSGEAHRPWGKIHRDYKSTIDGVRYVLEWVPGSGTCLVPYRPPAK